MMPQERVAAKSQELHQIVDELLTVVSDAVQQYTPIHEVESKALKILLRGGRRAVQLLVDCLGDGDVGEEHQLPEGTLVKRSEEPQQRDYVSIFGEIDIQRYVYAQRKGQAGGGLRNAVSLGRDVALGAGWMRCCDERIG